MTFAIAFAVLLILFALSVFIGRFIRVGRGE